MKYKFYNSGNFLKRIVFLGIILLLFVLALNGGGLASEFWANTSTLSIILSMILTFSLVIFLFNALTELVLDFSNGGYRLGLTEEFLWSRDVAETGIILWDNVKYIEISHMESFLSHILVKNPFINTKYLYAELKKPVLVGRFRKKMQNSVMIPLDFLSEPISTIECKIYECCPELKAKI